MCIRDSHRAGRARLQDPGTDLQVAFTDGTRVQSALSAHIQRKGCVGAPPQRNWHFLPMPGTTVTFPVGPGASAYLEDIASYRPCLLYTSRCV